MVNFLCPLRRPSVIRFRNLPFLAGSEALRSRSFLQGKGGRGVTSGQVMSVLMKSCVFLRFFFKICMSLTRGYKIFLVVLQYGATVRLREGDQPTPNDDLESGQVKTSATPDLSLDGDSAPTLFVPMGPTGPVTSHQDLPLPASVPVLAGSKDLAGGFPVPLPPVEPFDAFLLHTGRTKQDSASLVPQPATTAPPKDLVTLPAALPFPTYEGPVQTSKDPSPAPRLCMPLPGRFYAPPPLAWSWP